MPMPKEFVFSFYFCLTINSANELNIRKTRPEKAIYAKTFVILQQLLKTDPKTVNITTLL